MGKGENAGIQHFLLFSQCFLHLLKREIVILAMFNMSSEIVSICSHPKCCHLAKSSTDFEFVVLVYRCIEYKMAQHCGMGECLIILAHIRGFLLPFPTQQNFRLAQTERVCRRRLQI